MLTITIPNNAIQLYMTLQYNTKLRSAHMITGQNIANTFDFTRANSGRSKGYMIVIYANRQHQYTNLTYFSAAQKGKT